MKDWSALKEPEALELSGNAITGVVVRASGEAANDEAFHCEFPTHWLIGWFWSTNTSRNCGDDPSSAVKDA